MNPIEIALIVIGIIAIVVSFLIADKDVADKNIKDSVNDLLSDENKKFIREKIEAVLSEVSEEIVVRTDDALDKLSNEKIMAVNDFSEQILEKIRRNHEEVVFLYSMLENKEKELKAAVKEIDLSKKKLQSMFEAKSSEGTEHNQPDAGQNMEKTLPSAPAESKPVHNNAVALGSSDSDSTADRISNQQILDLYSQGKSVLEISRMLDLGQGEVKLVIDLFKGKK